MIEGRRERAAKADALRRAYEAHATALLRLSVLLAGRQDAAEDLVQETFVRTADALERLGEDEVRAYLRATAMNLWRNRLRRLALERRLRRAPDRDPDLPFEERDAMWGAIRQLPPRQRACLVLRYFEDLSERETAQLLGCSVGTLKSQTSRALLRVRRELRHED